MDDGRRYGLPIGSTNDPRTRLIRLMPIPRPSDDPVLTTRRANSRRIQWKRDNHLRAAGFPAHITGTFKRTQVH